MTTKMLEAFDAMGAEATIVTGGHAFEIDIQEADGQEQFKLTYPSWDTITAEVLDVKTHLRHLVLDVTGWRLPIAGRYLCGHDERHWFVASLPFDRRTATVRGAMEALKPEVVRREQKRKGVKHRRNRRRTAAYVRQGEWFFLPRPMMHIGEQAERGGGKPHQVEWLYQPEGTDDTFVRGAVSHPDHETIYLQVWHRVVQNAEVVQDEANPVPWTDTFTRMAYLD